MAGVVILGDERARTTGVPADEHLTLSDAQWERACLQAKVIERLATRDSPSLAATDEAGLELGISRRQVYVLLRRFRQGSGRVTDLLPAHSTGGRGGGRLDGEVEQVIREVLRKRFLSRQKRSTSVIHREIRQMCRAKGLPVPSWNTVASRIDQMRPVDVARRRGGPDAARPLQSAGDEVPQASEILEQVQIDHTVIDVIVVDEYERQPVGRPYLTLAIDQFSRAVVGMVVTLEPPSATSVGLCLTHMVTDKRPWLEHLNVGASWPMSGKPQRLYLDNAAEFKSEALQRGCDQHGIKLLYRPPGRPHYGGIIERVIGTAMQRVHELPGTTFSNPTQRGSYDSDQQSALTLDELTRWLTLAIATYHGSIHSTLGQTPAGGWAEGIAASGSPMIVTDQTGFLIDFLPVLRRTLTRTGFVIDHVHYFANALKPWIARRDQLGAFIIRRDPRDISRIWVLDPNGSQYVPVPYRNLSHPAASLWEHRQAMARLKERGAEQVDENALFQAIDQMRRISDEATRTTRRTRRAAERRRHSPTTDTSRRPTGPPDPPETADDDVEAQAAPFEEIEQW